MRQSLRAFEQLPEKWSACGRFLNCLKGVNDCLIKPDPSFNIPLETEITQEVAKTTQLFLL